MTAITLSQHQLSLPQLSSWSQAAGGDAVTACMTACMTAVIASELSSWSQAAGGYAGED